MDIRLVMKTARSATIELNDGGTYETKERYRLLLNVRRGGRGGERGVQAHMDASGQKDRAGRQVPGLGAGCDGEDVGQCAAG